MTAVTIFGKGNMGTAIADVLSAGGATVQQLDSSDASATVNGDLVVLAVPYAAIPDIVAKYGDQFSGRAVVDISNPVDRATFDGLLVSADGSAAAELAAALPQARVLKAFNTNFAGTLAARKLGGQPTTVLIAGDDTDAKRALAEAVTAGGLTALDAGSLRRARELEAVGFLQMTLAAAERISWTGGFALVG